MFVIEPNGYNPVLKVLEKVSRYHIEHEERSFFPATLHAWRAVPETNPDAYPLEMLTNILATGRSKYC